MNYKTPGVYIEEISLLPPSVAQVETAIPAFIGYTEIAEDADGNDLANTPTRIKSFLEYKEKFGGAHDQDLKMTLGETSPFAPKKVEIDGAVSPYNMYYALQMFFANGGGPCYIVSVGDYDKDDATKPSLDNIDDYNELKGGLDAIKKTDEITLIVFPEAIRLSDDLKATLYKDSLMQCNDLQDRFSIFDVSEHDTDGTIFRNGIGNQYLNYGASYYPYLKSSLPYVYAPSTVKFVQSVSTVFNGFTMEQIGTLADALNYEVLIDASAVVVEDAKVSSEEVGIALADKIVFCNIMKKGVEKMRDNIQATFDLITADPFTNDNKTDGDGKTDDALAVVGETEPDIDSKIALLVEAKDFYKASIHQLIAQVNLDTGTDSGDNDVVLATYTNSYIAELKTLLSSFTVTLPPSPIVAGIYASVDENRGVWKSPANVSINNVSGPIVKIDNTDNDNFNVHSTGKSINVIRAFTGKGTLIWGARTLDGNSNEWRYISVRRFFIMAEESIQKASERFVFEPNDANTWVRVKAMIENFLILQWRAGALMGAKSSDAFFVKVGLGETMTPDDVYNGKMIIEVGLAVVRPAEFIILRFSHKMLES
ncbi:MAG: phage tail sheath C-terminal domain-containing protein [Saprospiraceae bacterium]|nr:phage tail sheath C-terminal domain-containing protein [Saprospiraceae bacterium]